MDLLLNNNIMITVLSYISWNDLRKYENVPDTLWKRICDHFCEDSGFKYCFETYWKNKRQDTSANQKMSHHLRSWQNKACDVLYSKNQSGVSYLLNLFSYKDLFLYYINNLIPRFQ